MYEIADQVARWIADGRPALLARVIETAGISSRDRAATVAYSPGEPLAGKLFAGAADPILLELFAAITEPSIITVPISQAAAAMVGLSCGGSARLLVEPVSAVPLWKLLRGRRPVCLLTDLASLHTEAFEQSELPRSADPDDRAAEIGRIFKRGVSQTVLLADPATVVTAYWPTVRVFIVGSGQIADALVANGMLLDWQVEVAAELPEAEFTAADNIIVLDHDLDVSGAALSLALASAAGYVGALGSRRTQAARAGWLAEHGVGPAAIASIRGPAGLAIGSRTPAEIALSILAEILQVRSSR